MGSVAGVWSADEIGFLIACHESNWSYKDIALELNREYKSVWYKGKNLGLTIHIKDKKKQNKDYIIELKKHNINIISIGEYIGSNIKIAHKCIKCEHIWNVSPNHLLSSNTGCPICNTTKHTLEYIDSILDNHNIKRISSYEGTLKDITVKSSICNHTWTTKFSNIQQGAGCPLCNRGFGYNKNKDNIPQKAIVYLLKINLVDKQSFLKIGVTSKSTINPRLRTLKYALKNELDNIEIIKEINTSGKQALVIEHNILIKFKRYKYTTKFSGYTELLNLEDMSAIINNMGDNI